MAYGHANMISCSSTVRNTQCHVTRHTWNMAISLYQYNISLIIGRDYTVHACKVPLISS